MKGGITMAKKDRNRENNLRKQNEERKADVELGQQRNAGRENQNRK